MRLPLYTNTKPVGAQAHRAGVSHIQGIAPSATFSLASCTLDLSDSSDHPHPAMFDVDLHDCEDVDLQRLARGLHDYTDLFGDLNSRQDLF